MKIAQKCAVGVWVVIAYRVQWGVATINWGSCNHETQVPTLRRGMEEAVHMLHRADGRLRKLYTWLKTPHQVDIDQQGSVILGSTFRTYQMYMDSEVAKVNTYPESVRERVLDRLKKVIERCTVMTKDIDNALAQPEDDGKRTRLLLSPVLNFQCDDNWMVHTGDMMINGQPHIYFQDGRQYAQGGPTSFPPARRTQFVIEGRSTKPFHGPLKDQFPSLIVNEMTEPYRSVMCINPIKFSQWNMLFDPLGRAALSDEINRGEAEFNEMRVNQTIRPFSWHIEQLLAHHASAALIGILGSSDAVTTASRGYTFGGETTVGDRDWRVKDNPECTGGAMPHKGTDHWACMVSLARQSQYDGVRDRFAYQLLLIALYLDNFDWSTGFNVPLERAIGYPQRGDYPWLLPPIPVDQPHLSYPATGPRARRGGPTRTN